MFVKCFYVGFGTVYNIEFKNKDDTIWNSGLVNRDIDASILKDYTFENIAFYILAGHIKYFLAHTENVKKIIIYTAIEQPVINETLKTPKTAAEIYLAELYKNKQIDFDSRGDGVLAMPSRVVAYEYLKLKKAGQDTKFGLMVKNEDPFNDFLADRYNVYN